MSLHAIVMAALVADKKLFIDFFQLQRKEIKSGKKIENLRIS